MADELLPPVVVKFLGEPGELLAATAAVKAELRSVTEATIVAGKEQAAATKQYLAEQRAATQRYAVEQKAELERWKANQVAIQRAVDGEQAAEIKRYQVEQTAATARYRAESDAATKRWYAEQNLMLRRQMAEQRMLARRSAEESGTSRAMTKVAGASPIGAAVGGEAFLGMGAGGIAIGAVAGVTAAMVAAGAASIKMAASFNQQMELIHTQAGASQAEVDALKGKVLDLAAATGVGPEKLAEGLYHVESAGFRGKEALDITAAAAKLVAIGMSDAETTTQALIGTMAVGFKDVRDAADAGAYLNQIVGIGDMRMEKLAAAISTGVLPSFKTAGLGMKDFGAALATLTDNVTPADEAATRLRMTVALLGAPSHVAYKALSAIGLGAEEANKALSHRDYLEHYGISISQLSEDLRKPDGLLVAVMDLKTHLEKSGLTASEQAAVIQKAFGGGRTSGAIMTLLQETDRLKDKYHELGDAESRAAKLNESWTAQKQQLTQVWNQIKAGAEATAVRVGEVLMPGLTGRIGVAQGFFSRIGAGFKGSNVGKEIADSFSKTDKGVVDFAGKQFNALADFIVAHKKDFIDLAHIIAHDVIPVLGVLAKGGLLYIRGVISLVVIAVHNAVAVFHALVAVWHGLKKAGEVVWHALVAAWHWIAMQAKKIWHDVVAVIRVPLLFLKGFFGEIFHHIWEKTIHPFVVWVDKKFVTPTKKLIHELAGWWSEKWNAIKAKFVEVRTVLATEWGKFHAKFIAPIEDAIGVLRDKWHAVWESIAGKVEAVWDRVSGILKKIRDVVSGSVGDILKDPAGAGKKLARILGFAQGGWVPGPVGAPQMVVVHGGEFVVSRDMMTGRAPAPSFASNGGVGGVGGGGVVHEFHLYLDGAELRIANIREAQRRKVRNGTSGYT